MFETNLTYNNEGLKANSVENQNLSGVSSETKNPENYVDETQTTPVVCSELEWVNRAEDVLNAIKENVTTRISCKTNLQRIKPEIEAIMAALAEKQAEAERIKDDIELLELECQELKEKLSGEMSE